MFPSVPYQLNNRMKINILRVTATVKSILFLHFLKLNFYSNSFPFYFFILYLLIFFFFDESDILKF